MLHVVFKEKPKIQMPFLFVPFFNERDTIGRLLPKIAETPQKKKPITSDDISQFHRHFKISSPTRIKYSYICSQNIK